ncbi:MAG: hypothetical protein KC609_09795, partial [Myxococcales bacterium]|nr:hypothetical protein [Myxococcales bacterium]
MQRSIWFLILLILSWTSAPFAHADYATFFKKGLRAQKKGHHREAIALFDRAVASEPRPGAKYFKALSLMAL